MFNTRPFLALVLVASYASAAVLNFGANGLKKKAPGDVVTQCTVPGTVALTFDDGPYIWETDIVDSLNAAGAKGTFFVNGNNWACIYEDSMVSRLQYAYGAGHQIASHTWAHLHLPTLDAASLNTQFFLVEDAIHKITGAYPAFTRPPYGEYNQLVQDVAASRGQTLVNWDFDNGDTAGLSGAQSLDSYRARIADHPSTILTLNHEINPSTPQIVPEVIAQLQAAGYTLVTLAECLGEAPYQYVDEPQPRDSTWTCAV
ncbi:chitin deacetylase [Ephemerocybe angulata]|uniref:Chitin deacetylase n=1 Tax=Ephemerocybe angulata TaxID=980116 RepID=A0A8H6I0W4_9AGAR|nr:chitin deacetylase [Tulosesus angulatus]